MLWKNLKIKDNLLYTDMELFEERMNICKNCAIYASATQTCSAQLWLDPVTNTAYDSAAPGRIKGCGCYLPNKTKREENSCPAKKW